MTKFSMSCAPYKGNSTRPDVRLTTSYQQNPTELSTSQVGLFCVRFNLMSRSTYAELFTELVEWDLLGLFLRALQVLQPALRMQIYA